MSLFGRVRRLLGLGGENTPTVNLPQDEPPAPFDGENLLLVSDLHLGEACKDHTRIEYLKRGVQLDGHFCAFLEHHTRKRPNGRPWRLILGGDLFDFLQVTISPPGASEEERIYGLGASEADSTWKLERLMERHRQVFVYLADFVGAGNRLEVIQGNHDEELFWPAVRAAFTDGLVKLFFGGEHHQESPQAFADRIHFNPWFYYQPGLLYVEHGHRFDDFCATTPQLCPLRPQGEDELLQPVSALAVRYFANQELGFSTHSKEHWRIPDYARYYKRQGWGSVANMFRRYGSLIRRIVAYHLEYARFESEQALSEHQRRLDELAEQINLDRSVLDQLDSLGAVTAISQPFGLFTILGMAEWTGGALFVSTVLLALLTSWGWTVDLILIALALLSAREWSRYARRQFPTDVRRKLRIAATQISEILAVPVVAMGHSHAPIRMRLPHDHRSFFINTGSFLAGHTHHTPDEPCTCRTTFAVIEDPQHARPKPMIHRWCCVRQTPAPFGPEDNAQYN